MKGLILLLVSVMWSLSLSAQDFKKDLEKVYAQYQQSEQLYMEMHIKGYEGSLKNKPLFNQETKVYKQKQNYFYNMGSKEVLRNRDFVIWVDKGQKSMICTKRLKVEKPNAMFGNLPDVEKLLSQFNEAEYLGLKNGLKHYRVTQADKEVIQNDIYINPQTNLPAKVVYTYNPERYKKGYWIEIDFGKTTTTPTFQANTFDEGKYIRNVNNKWKPQVGYQQYEVIFTENDF